MGARLSLRAGGHAARRGAALRVFQMEEVVVGMIPESSPRTRSVGRTGFR